MVTKDTNGTLKSLYNMEEILRYIQRNTQVGVTEIAGSVDLSKSAVHHYLASLQDLGFVVNEQGTYRLGLQFLTHGIAAKNNYEVANTSSSVLESAEETISLPVWVGVRENNRIILIEKSNKRSKNLFGQVGKQLPLHSSATGKLFLAYDEADDIAGILNETDATKYTEHTDTDSESLAEELETVRSRKMAFSEGETVLGIHSVAVPILADGEIHGALSVFGRANQLIGDYFYEEIPDSLLDAARTIEDELEWEAD